MTTTELIELLKKYERGGATGRPREVMFEVDDRIIDTVGIEVIGSGDGLISELYLSLPSTPTVKSEDAKLHESCTDCPLYDHDRHRCPRFNKVIPTAIQDAMSEGKKGKWVKHVTGHSTYYDCSRCSCIAPWTETADAFLWEMTNYCPNCGARMENDEV